ncbi:MAG: histidine--tRNA ligase [Pseudomonadota bacterium]
MIKAIRGFRDVLPEETQKWQLMETKAREVFGSFGFREIRPPLLEKTDLFLRAIGEATDIAEKEMYTFTDRNGESVTLRPEATASVLRAFIEHSLYSQERVHKLYTIGPMFRHERPQKGRHRQFHQMNAEAIGEESPLADAEIIAVAMRIMGVLCVENKELQMNSLGCSKCRPQYRQELQVFLEEKKDELCPDCRRRAQTNPLRVLDCKVEECKAALGGVPLILNRLCPECTRHFETVQKYLTSFGISFSVNPLMVRGLDYYSRTTFEIVSSALGAQSAIAAGGRYDRLIKDLGGPELPGIGFAIGMERLFLLLGASEAGAEPLLFVAALGEKAFELAVRIVYEARLAGVRAEMEYDVSSMKSQMRRANKLGAQLVLIVGDEELASGKIIVRDMKTARQWNVPLDSDVAAFVRGIGDELRRSVR